MTRQKPWWSDSAFTYVLKEDRHAVAERPLEDRSVVILGGGPRLTAETAHTLAQTRSIAVNNAYQFFDYPALVVALDRRWWGWHGNALKGAGHVGVTSLREKQPAPVGFSGLRFQKERVAPFDTCRSTLAGINSGHAAICLAIHLGAARIYLAGFDMAFEGLKTHWHGGHNVPSSEANYTNRFRPALEALVGIADQLSVQVSAITPSAAAIPTTPLDVALEDLRA
jgi:hypothetical protein